MADYGTDIRVSPDLSEDDNLLISGLDCLGQDLALRLDTPRGSLLSDPNYGVDLRSYLSAGMTPRQMLEVVVLVKNEIEADDRVESAEVTSSYDAVKRELTIKAVVTTGEGPYEYTFRITSSGVTVT